MRELPVTEVTDDALMSLNHVDARRAGIPGGGGLMTAATMALFYQALLHNDAGIWDDATLRDATSTVRNNLPDVFSGTPANRALGVVVAGDDGNAKYRGFGHTQSPGNVRPQRRRRPDRLGRPRVGAVVLLPHERKRPEHHPPGPPVDRTIQPGCPVRWGVTARSDPDHRG